MKGNLHNYCFSPKDLGVAFLGIAFFVSFGMKKKYKKSDEKLRQTVSEGSEILDSQWLKGKLNELANYKISG